MLEVVEDDRAVDDGLGVEPHAGGCEDRRAMQRPVETVARYREAHRADAPLPDVEHEPGGTGTDDPRGVLLGVPAGAGDRAGEDGLVAPELSSIDRAGHAYRPQTSPVGPRVVEAVTVRVPNDAVHAHVRAVLGDVARDHDLRLLLEPLVPGGGEHQVVPPDHNALGLQGVASRGEVYTRGVTDAPAPELGCGPVPGGPELQLELERTLQRPLGYGVPVLDATDDNGGAVLGDQICGVASAVGEGDVDREQGLAGTLQRLGVREVGPDELVLGPLL